MRLDRLLAQEGFGTRSEIKKAIRSGRAAVNGTIEKDPGRQISSDDEVRFDDKVIARAEFVYYMLYKPAGVITATEDSRTATVLDLLRTPESSGSPSERQPVQPSRSVQPVLRRMFRHRSVPIRLLQPVRPLVSHEAGPVPEQG